MTHREYLHEDIRLIRKYFPGAQTVSLHTPFDLTLAPENPWEACADDRAHPAVEQSGDLLWSR
jgi:hypothetical protein